MKKYIYKNQSTRGLTLIEMMVVVVVLGMLVALTSFGYRNWQQGLAERQAQSDLHIVASAMKNAQSFGTTGYPSSVPSTFNPSEDMDVTYVGGNKAAYCVEAQSLAQTSIVYHFDSAAGRPQPGICPPGYNLGAPNPSATSPSASSIVVSWSGVAGATSYIVKYGTSTPSSTTTCGSSPCTISGLQAGTDYIVTVTASNSLSSVESSGVGIKTQYAAPPAIPAPSSATVAYTKPSYIKGSDGFYYYRYIVTSSGGTCSVGSTQWRIGISPNPPTSTTWSGLTWQSSNVRTIDVSATGIYSPTDVYIFAKPRCLSGSSSTEGAAAMTTYGSPNGI